HAHVVVGAGFDGVSPSVVRGESRPGRPLRDAPAATAEVRSADGGAGGSVPTSAALRWRVPPARARTTVMTVAPAVRRSVLGRLVSEAVRIDRSIVSSSIALRNALGVLLPLVVGAAAGHLVVGLTMAVGAL